MQALSKYLRLIAEWFRGGFAESCKKLSTRCSAMYNKLTIKTKMVLWEIFLGLLLVCVFIVTNKIAVLASQNASKDAVVSGDVVMEVRNDTILGRNYAVKLHRTDVQEYDYWLYTDSVYKVGDKIKQ